MYLNVEAMYLNLEALGLYHLVILHYSLLWIHCTVYPKVPMSFVLAGPSCIINLLSLTIHLFVYNFMNLCA
jgi:hypothetical protein